MNISRSIFRSYDIRGVVPSQLNSETAEHIGKALGTYSLRKKIGNSFVVGEDNRSSSPELSKAFIKGLTSTGCNVTYIGLTMTPVIHYLTCVEPFDFGINVTASHNPKEFNGFRIDTANATPFYGDSLQEIYSLVVSEDYLEGNGSVTHKDLFPLYLEHLKGRFSFSSNTKVVLDCGNGSASQFAPEIFKTLGCTVTPLYCDLNSDFPHGIPDPENRLFMSGLGQSVIDHKASVGFAFDTDVDRFGLVDNKGNIYESDKTLLMFAEQKLKDHPGSTILFDVKCSIIVKDLVSRWNGVAKLMRTGHPYFTEEIRKGALMGCEYSGHVYFGGNHYGYDDGIYAACKAIQYSERQNRSFYDMLRSYPPMYHTSEIKIPCSDNLKFKVIEDVVNTARNISEVKEILTVDGVRVELSDKEWFLIRASNTTPKLSIRVEASNNLQTQQLLKTVEKTLEPYELDLKQLREADIYVS